MTRKLLIIGGGILGVISASVVAKAGGLSEIVTEQVLGPSGASHYSGRVHFPYGCQDRTRSLTRKSAVVLAAMAGSAVGWCRPLATRVAAGPGEPNDPAQFTEALDPAEPDIGSLAPSFCGQNPSERNALSIAVPHARDRLRGPATSPAPDCPNWDVRPTSLSNRRLFAC